MTTESNAIDKLRSHCSSVEVTPFRDQTRVVVPRHELADALALLHGSLGFDLLIDITCVDYLGYRGATDRFGLVYLLSNSTTNERITLRVMLNEPDLSVVSAVSLWEGADWLEREVWDMFGIRFQGHSDLKRILMYDEFEGHPLRKDYPVNKRQPLIGPVN